MLLKELNLILKYYRKEGYLCQQRCTKLKFNHKARQFQDMKHCSSSLAFHKLQAAFPTLTLPTLKTPQLPFLDSLHNLTTALPLPGEEDLAHTLSYMRQIMDEQEYQYQRSLLKDHREDEMLSFDEECSYQQRSTGIMCRKDTACTPYDSCNTSSFVDAVWNWKGERESDQPKEEYFYFFD